MGTRTLLTTEEYAQMHTSEREVYELVDGELIPLPSALPIHGIICANVAAWIAIYLRHWQGAV
jgi:Uma2 family endonuclease